MELPFDVQSLPRELNRHYIAASEEEIQSMLNRVGAASLDALYGHIPADSRFLEAPELPEELSYVTLQERLSALSLRNAPRAETSFLGDGLPSFQVPAIVDKVAGIRNLTTAYTPYQPERSQGTLVTHWIYQCLMSQLTGFEAINSSLYDRSTAIFEAACTAIRLHRKADMVLIPEAIYPGDLEVVQTLARDTEVKIRTLPLSPATGRIDLDALEAEATKIGDQLAAIVYPQVNCLGLLEDVDSLQNLASKLGVKGIAVIDPMLLGTGGLKPPVAFGERGADIIVGEAQHLAIAPNFGGPGLGLFGVRHNASVRNDIRQTPGRYVGKASDLDGRECLVMVLSTREQHIRKDKATSNICSNQAFLATLAGAALLVRGEEGMRNAAERSHQQAVSAIQRLTSLPGIDLAFPNAPFWNEIVVTAPAAPAELIERASQAGIHLGVDVSNRVVGDRRLLKLSFSDVPVDLDALVSFFEAQSFTGEPTHRDPAAPPPSFLRAGSVGLPQHAPESVEAYYQQLGELNVSPDDACYPLGSCTMKYNPHINDWAANLSGFTQLHPQAPIADAQGSLELLHEIQEWFQKITGLPGVTTQPVAGAQGELVGIKLFQAYHRAQGEAHRDVILIPSSAHGTNFATAAMAGYPTKKVDGRLSGIVFLESGPDGLIDEADFDRKLAEYGDRLVGIMVTNPNTCGLFETRFRALAEKVHAVGGLVYMDGANMNAIAGWLDLGAMGVDAVHNNLHKTWTIPHGGGGPGDAIVAVSEKLIPFLPGYQIEKQPDGTFVPVKPPQSIGSFHRHWGNFAHKIRAYAYLLRLGREGVRRMTALATLSARYCFEELKADYPFLPEGSAGQPRMHEFILTISKEDFARLEAVGVPSALAVTRIGKLFLDFGFHAPTVAWPETFGLMIEPTESYRQAELDRFCTAVKAIRRMLREHPEVLKVVPLFTPVERIDDVAANRNLVLHESLEQLPTLHPNRLAPSVIAEMPIDELYDRIVAEAQKRLAADSVA